MDEHQTPDAAVIEAEAIEPVGEVLAQPASEAMDATGEAAGALDMAVAAGDAERIALLGDIGVSTIYLMGTSFILGVLFTVFVLLVLDFMRRNAEEDK